MISLRSNLSRHVVSGVTPEQSADKEHEAAKRLFHERALVVIPLDHPAVKGALRAIVEGLGNQIYGKRTP